MEEPELPKKRKLLSGNDEGRQKQKTLLACTIVSAVSRLEEVLLYYM